MKTTLFSAMGSKVFVAVDSAEQHVIDEAMKAQQWFEEWEQVLSRFRFSSELSEINRHPGAAIKVSQTIAEVLLAARNAERLSEGLVTPTMLNALTLAGYDEDFESLLRRSPAEFKQALTTPVRPGKVDFDEHNQTLTLPFGTTLDFGGIAKGWAAHQTMLRLSHYAPVLVDAGGDIAVSGPMQDGGQWPIGVANPFDQDNNLALLMLSGGGVATSGKDYHRWLFNGEMQHHIIDPRSLRPATSDVLTITVVAEDVMAAEAYAKAALIQGSEAGVAWLDRQKGVGYLLVLEDGSVIKNQLFYEKEWKPECQTK
jgi:thiamine biosynthesis lipoprotein